MYYYILVSFIFPDKNYEYVGKFFDDYEYSEYYENMLYEICDLTPNKHFKY